MRCFASNMISRKQMCCKEFAIEKINLTQENYLEFYQSQWQRKNNLNAYYVIYRIIMALVFAVTLIISIIDLNYINKSAVLRAKWLIYLTNWHFSVQTLQLILSAYLVSSMYLYVRKNGEYMQLSGINRILCSVYWAFYTIAINGALFVTIVYWTAVYDEEKDPLSVINVFTHAINAVLLMIDCFIVAHSVRIMHFYLPIAFNMIYVAFSIIYFLSGGTDKHNFSYIYSILKWDHPLIAIRNSIFNFFFILLLHTFIYLCVKFRKRIAKAFKKHENLDNVFFSTNYLMESLKECSTEKKSQYIEE